MSVYEESSGTNMLARSCRMSIRRLRKDHPSWNWSCTRIGAFGRIVYTGDRGDPNAEYEQVEIFAVGVLCGPSDDDFCTRWDAEHSRTSNGYRDPFKTWRETYAMWSARELGGAAPV